MNTANITGNGTSCSHARRCPGGDSRRLRVVEGRQDGQAGPGRDITNDEGNRLLGIVRRASGSVLTWRRAQLVLLSAQAMEVSEIARVTFTSEDRVRDVLHNFNLPGRRGVVDDISHEGLRVLLHQEGVSFQR